MGSHLYFCWRPQFVPKDVRPKYEREDVPGVPWVRLPGLFDLRFNTRLQLYYFLNLVQQLQRNEIEVALSNVRGFKVFMAERHLTWNDDTDYGHSKRSWHKQCEEMIAAHRTVEGVLAALQKEFESALHGRLTHAKRRELLCLFDEKRMYVTTG